jgi:uracil-DNA glycosylase family 4
LGFARHTVFTTSLLKCGVHEPSPAEWGACRAHFERELSLLQPSFIVSLGTLTSQILLNEGTPVIGEWREINGIPVLGTHHFKDAVTPQAHQLKRSMANHLKRLKLRLEAQRAEPL